MLSMNEKSKKILAGVIALVVAVIVYKFLPESCPEAGRRAAFVFVVAAAFWALEVIPLYATSLVVILLQILLLGKPGGVLGMDENGYTIFFAPFSSPVIMLFFGGFILAIAMQKYRIDRLVAGKLLHLFGKKPYHIMFGFMLTTAFLSVWLSNTATTAIHNWFEAQTRFEVPVYLSPMVAHPTKTPVCSTRSPFYWFCR